MRIASPPIDFSGITLIATRNRDGESRWSRNASRVGPGSVTIAAAKAG
jgi:hypothetical protein